MFQHLVLEYYNPQLNIAFSNVREVWLLNKPPVCLAPALHRGALIYRIPTSGKRISYRQLKKGLIKQKMVISISLQLLPF